MLSGPKIKYVLLVESIPLRNHVGCVIPYTQHPAAVSRLIAADRLDLELPVHPGWDRAIIEINTLMGNEDATKQNEDPKTRERLEENLPGTWKNRFDIPLSFPWDHNTQLVHHLHFTNSGDAWCAIFDCFLRLNLLLGLGFRDFGPSELVFVGHGGLIEDAHNARTRSLNEY